jgi:ribonuclease VapC
VTVLDASAVLAYLNSEPGAAVVASLLPGAIMSIVNVAEVLTKHVEKGQTAQQALDDIRDLGVTIVPFEERQALQAAELRRQTASRGLSIGDRACLALAIVRNEDVVTADRAWAFLSLPVKIALIR